MRHRKLGRTNIEVSEIGLGAWQLGGGLWKGGTDEEGREALRAAIETGITFIDTALVYGEGHSERLIGGVLAERGGPDGVSIASKVPPMDFSWPGRAETPLREVFPPSHVVASTEASLRNLQLDAVDLMQLHVWSDRWLEDPLWAETRAAMERLKSEGKVRHWGVSVNSHAPETAMELIRDPLIETAQLIYNIYDRSPEQGFFDLVREYRTGVIVRVPFDEGALTGTIGPATSFEPGDFRERYFAGTRKAEAAQRAEALGKLLGDEAKSLPELALRFCLGRPEVSTVIPGMRRPKHVRANAAVSDGRALSLAMMTSLRDHAWEKNWYGG